MAPSKKRKRVAKNAAPKDEELETEIPSIPSLVPLTPEELHDWKGFVEIESEPALFNDMLKRFGVRGARLQEVFSLEAEMLAFLPRPVYGLIFLYKYRSPDVNKQEASCPDHVWFANQTHNFACATYCLLNIVNNVPEIELGPHLQSFKDFTADLTPAQRGDAIGDFDFVRQIHNSFARKMDMFNIDLGMQNEFDDRRKKVTAAAATSKKGKSKKGTVTIDDYMDDDAAFHFTAFVPVQGQVWKLDGLNRQPEKLGKCATEDWMAIVTPAIEAQMLEYTAGHIEFQLQALVKDPLVDLRQLLSENVVSLRNHERYLTAVDNRWKEAINVEETDLITCEDEFYGVSKVDMDLTNTARGAFDGLGLDQLLENRQGLVRAQAQLRSDIRRELETEAEELQRALEHRHDYGSFIRLWLELLAQKEAVLQEILEEIR